MAGMINRDDIAQVRERAPLEDIIGQHVTLKNAGVGSLKGLCPFHDERSPSFHVRPTAGHWHCFGCGEGGDAIAFLQKMDGMSFTEAVEYLAERTNVTLRYESGGARGPEQQPGLRKRLLEAHRIAAEFYEAALESPEAQTGRDFLNGRGFDKEAAATFGVGYAPQGWSNLLDHLRGKGFTEPELKASGLMSEGQRGIYDRFRGRLVWPIRSVTGEVVGFGARKLYDDDQGPKYLNSPETALYKKAHVLYGLDVAKKAIGKTKQVVVVEGYTDVMACHLAGVETAVATCGTAFGEDHVKVVRRLLGDSQGAQLKVGASSSEVIFTFDGDDAGQNAALKAFQLEQKFVTSTFVAVDKEGRDPCDLRLADGDAAVVALVKSRVPLFEFVIKAALAGNDLETPEGRVMALRAAAPVVAGIQDRALRPEYVRRLAGWLGIDMGEVRGAVQAAGRTAQNAQRQAPASQGASAQRPAAQRPQSSGGFNPDEPPPLDPESGMSPEELAAERREMAAAPIVVPNAKDPMVRAERMALEVMLQAPAEIDAALYEAVTPEAFAVPVYRAVFDGIRAAGGVTQTGGNWVSRVVDEVGPALAGLVSELAVSPLPHDRPAELRFYTADVLKRVQDTSLTRQIADARGRMQRAGEGTDGYQAAFGDLMALETQRRALREQ